ncbi:MAG: hypothetical protein ACR2QF_17890, partial [Geminicoccaceae bacterium]
MGFRTIVILGTLVLAVAGCSSERPKGSVCQGVCAHQDGPINLIRRTDSEPADAKAKTALSAIASEDLGRQLRALMRQKADIVPQGVPERALSDLPRTEEGRLN